MNTSQSIVPEERGEKLEKLTSRSSMASNLGMKSRCEMSPTQEKVNPGKNIGWRVLTE